jgi:hypothetical protein
MMKTMLVLTLSINFLLSGCGQSFIEAMTAIEPSHDPDYGYTTSDAIRIGYFEPTMSIRATYHYLSRLRTPEGKKFKVLERRGSYADGSYRNSILDGYSLVNEQRQDTVILFFDIYNSAPLRIPIGMTWEAPKE